MKDWQVNVITKSGNQMSLKMSGYDYEDDAVNAAMSQCDAVRLISSTYIGDTNKFPTTAIPPIRDFEQIDFDFDYRSLIPTKPNRNKPFLLKLFDFFIAGFVPTLLLMLIHVGLGVGFAVAFGSWWFST